MFADDTLPFRRCSGPSDVEHCCSVQEDTPRLGACADECNNNQKSACPHPALSPSRGTIPLVPTTTHLGVRLCCSLLWSEHAIQRVNFTECSPWNRTPRSSIWILQTSEAPASRSGCPPLEYAVPVWVSCSTDYLLSLGRVQLAVARDVLQASRRNHHNAVVLSKSGCPSLARRR